MAAVALRRLALLSSFAFWCEGAHLRSAQDTALAESDAKPHYPSRLGFIVHRKSGFILSYHASVCFNPDGRVVQRMMDPQIARPDFQHGSPEAVYAHLARDPIDLAVSNFLYDKFTSKEPGVLTKGTAAKETRRCKFVSESAYRQLPAVDGDETMREYLQRVSNHSGILATICLSEPIIGSMVKTSEWCKAHKERCMQVYANDLMKSSEIFMSSFKEIASLAGFQWTAELEECLSYQDVNDPKFGTTDNSKDDHCSTHSVTQEEREEIKNRARWLDKHFLDSFYANSSETLYSY